MRANQAGEGAGPAGGVSAGGVPAGEVPAHARLTRVVGIGWGALALAALAKAGVMDVLAGGGGVSAGDLATRCGCDRGTLARFLRAAAVTGAVEEPEPGRFAVTDLGRALLPETPGSADGYLRLSLAPEFLLPWTAAEQVLRTGRAGFDEVFGKSFYEHLAARPELARTFQSAMTATSSAEALLAAFDFPARGVVVDVGGGHGSVLTTLLCRHRGLTGVLVDLPHVVRGAGPQLAAAGVADRVAVAGGSFFEALPDGGDVYVLSRVLHNWDDADAVRILRGVRAAMPDGGRLLIVEPMSGGEEETAVPPTHDLLMLVLLGGRTRGREETAALLAEAGLREERVRRCPGGDAVVVAVPG